MDVGCNSYSLSKLSREDAFERMGALGFVAVELWTGHASYLREDLDPGAVVAEARRAGLVLRAYCIGGLFGLPRPLVQSRVERAFRFAAALGVGLVTGIVDRDAVPAVDVLCARHGMRFAIENHWYTQFARPADYATMLVATSPMIGVNIDTGHFAFLGCDLAAAARDLGGRTLNVHLKAVRRPGRLELLRRRLQRRYRMQPVLPRPGDGLDAFVAALAEAGYRGLLAVEHEAPGAEAELVVCRERAEQLVGRRTGGIGPAPEEARA